MPGSGQQEILHYRAHQDFFLTKPLLARAEDTTDIFNTEKLTQRGRQNEETEYVTSERTLCNYSRRSKKTEISSMPDNEFKIMITNIFNEL